MRIRRDFFSTASPDELYYFRCFAIAAAIIAADERHDADAYSRIVLSLL
jgi:hypothetical protein